MRITLLIITLFGLVFLSCAPQPHIIADRVKFAHAMALIKVGATKEQVLQILGTPSDIVTSPAPISYEHCAANGREAWCYGTDRHLGYPTLGYVIVSVGTADAVYGGTGDPPRKDLFKENELRDLLRFLNDQSRQPSDSLSIIRIVNRLQPLGMEKALAAVREYYRIDPFWGSAKDELPLIALRMLVDMPGDSPTNDHKPSVRYLYESLKEVPIAVMADVPIVLGRWDERYVHPNNEPDTPDPAAVIAEFALKGRMGNRLLVPTNSPFTEYDKVRKTYGEVFGVDWEDRSRRWHIKRTQLEADTSRTIIDELLALTYSVFHPDIEYGDGTELTPSVAKKNARLLRDGSALKLTWSPLGQQYTFLDGSTLPIEKFGEYQPVRWTPAIVGDIHGSIDIERFSPDRAQIRFGSNNSDGWFTPAYVRIYCANAPATTVAEAFLPSGFKLNDAEKALLRTGAPIASRHCDAQSGGGGATVFLPRGKQLIIEVIRNHKVVRSKPLLTDTPAY